MHFTEYKLFETAYVLEIKDVSQLFASGPRKNIICGIHFV